MHTFLPAKVIVSPTPIPDTSMGSWGKMIDYWLEQYAGNTIDYIFCPKSALPLKSQHTQAIDCSYPSSEINHPLFIKWRFRKFFAALKLLFSKYHYAVIVVIENTKLKNALTDWLERNKLQKNVRVIFFYMGFSYDFNRDEYRHFKKGLHEVMMQTHNAYDYERRKYHEFPFIVHVLHNPVNKQIFYNLLPEEKTSLRNKFGWQNNETVFLWVSHDRPKKGLDLILGIWPDVVAKYPQTRLIIVGAKRDYTFTGLHFTGKIPNQQIAAYYQAADVFLFSTLCMEGYGLSLSEAISCGCYCMASDSGGVPEVLAGTNHTLIADPNLEQSWLQAIDNYMQTRPIPSAGTPFLRNDEWCSAFEKILHKSGERLLQNQPS